VPRAASALPAGVTAASMWSAQDGSRELALLADDEGRGAVFDVQPGAAAPGERLSFASNFSLPPAASATGTAVASVLVGGATPKPWVVRVGAVTGCDLQLQLYELGGAQPRAVGAAVCLQSGVALPVATASSVSVAAVASSGAAHGVGVLAAAVRVEVLAAYSAGGAAVVYGATASLLVGTAAVGGGSVLHAARVNSHAVNLAAAAATAGTADSAPPPVPLDVGRAPSVSLAVLPDGGVAAAVVHADGFCWNNEAQNKDAGTGSCDQTPKSTPGVLVYTFGRLSDFATFLGREDSRWLSSCSARLAHGAYDQGRGQPSVALSWNASAPQPLAVLEMHEGFPAGGQDRGTCGKPLARPGALVLDSWALIDL